MKNVYQQKLIIIHSVAIIFYAWLVTGIAGCKAYGLSNCAQIYLVLLLTGAIPILFSYYLNKITYILLFLYSVLVSVVFLVFLPIGTVIGIFSILELIKYKQSRVSSPAQTLKRLSPFSSPLTQTLGQYFKRWVFLIVYLTAAAVMFAVFSVGGGDTQNFSHWLAVQIIFIICQPWILAIPYVFPEIAETEIETIMIISVLINTILIWCFIYFNLNKRF